jgi:alpha-1,6-mannosyltransferase
VTTQTMNEFALERGPARLLAAYAALVLLLVLVSARLWWQSPLDLIDHEFDYFLGLFESSDVALSETWVALGRRLHLFGFVLVGALYLVAVKRLARSPSSLDTRRIVAWSAVVSLFFALGMPWVSPDVFFYIGTGWLQSHYGVSPYVTSALAVPAAGQDQMFNNIYPGFLGSTTAYGPLFQKLAAIIAGLSGGNEKLALALHKVVALALHGGCSALVWRLAPTNFKRVALFSYAANPLICFSMLTCAHNDHWMNLFVLLALLAVSRRHWMLAGAALGAAFGIKYFPLVFVPVFALAALVQPREGGAAARNALDAARFVAGFAVVLALIYLPDPNALKAFANVASAGITVYRNSIYHLIDVATAWALPVFLDKPGFLATNQNVGAFLRGAYVVLYAILLLSLVDRLRRDTLRGIAEACLAVTLLYFLLVNSCNQEWYLTWLMGLALVLPHDRARSLAWWLSACFLPLVIFTVKNPAPIWFIANVALYGVVLVLGGRYMVSLVRTIRTRAWDARD